MKSQTESNPISTGDISSRVKEFHKDGVLKEMKRLYEEELKDFFVLNAKGEKVLREEVAVYVPCPICLTSQEKAEFAVNVNGFDHWRCPVCANVFVSPRLKDEHVWDQYERPSYKYMFQNLIENTLEFRKGVIAEGKYRWVTKRLKNPKAKTLLDIGSGLGENLAVYKEHGWEVVGIEFNEYAARKSRELYGVTVFNEPIERARLPRNQFDLITLWGVLEHLSQPIPVLTEVIKHLAPDGSLLVMVPNFDSLLGSYLKDYPRDADRLLDGDKHLVLYTRKGIEYLAHKMSLSIVDITTRGLDIATVLDYVSSESETRLYRLLKKELSKIQRGIEEVGLGDHLWVMLARSE